MEHHPEYNIIRRWDQDENATGDNQYHATVTRDHTSDVYGIEVTILDTYHQGVTIVLRPDGTYSVHPTGG